MFNLWYYEFSLSNHHMLQHQSGNWTNDWFELFWITCCVSELCAAFWMAKKTSLYSHEFILFFQTTDHKFNFEHEVWEKHIMPRFRKNFFFIYQRKPKLLWWIRNLDWFFGLGTFPRISFPWVTFLWIPFPRITFPCISFSLAMFPRISKCDSGKWDSEEM
jgi:hypothetical protein